jgi:hypothetical protein
METRLARSCGQNFYNYATSERHFFGHEHMRHATAAELLLYSVSAAERCLQMIAEIGHAE